MVVTLYQGNVVVMDDGGEVMLDAGERALLRPGQAPETGDRESFVVLREEKRGRRSFARPSHGERLWREHGQPLPPTMRPAATLLPGALC